MSSEHLERSLSLRRAGYSCGQSVLMPYAAEFGLDEELASAMALPLAGGMAKGRVCGCLSGAALVIGLKLGRGFPQNRDVKKESSRALRELTERLEAQYGCTNCHELLGLDPSTPEGGALFAQNNLRETVCIPVMELCIRFLDTL